MALCVAHAPAVNEPGENDALVGDSGISLAPTTLVEAALLLHILSRWAVESGQRKSLEAAHPGAPTSGI